MSQSRVAQVFAEEWPILVATLRKDLGDLGLAEEAAQDAFVEAAARWGPGSTPDRPGAWLLTTARRKAIDSIRRDQRFVDRLPRLLELSTTPQRPASEEGELVDDQLAMVFGCCHSSLATEVQIALTLRHVCGLSTEQIAAAFLVPGPTMAKRLTRAKKKIREANVPFVVPDAEGFSERLGAVLHVIYLIFSAGYASSDGAALIRGDLCDEARWLADVIVRLVGERAVDQQAEVLGLVALMAFTDARRASRTNDDGELVTLEHQDRSRWDQGLVAAGQAALAQALSQQGPGPYQLQATIAGLHSTAPTWADTQWEAIVAVYRRLEAIAPSPVIELNRAVAVSMADGPQSGLDIIDGLIERQQLIDYRYLHAARADMFRRLGRGEEAIVAYRRALALGGNDAERNFLLGRLQELSAHPDEL